MSNIYLSSFLGIFLLMNIVFFVAILKKRNDLIDVIWGPGFLLVIAIVLFSSRVSLSDHAALTLFMVASWCFRFVHYVGLRVFASKKEDLRFLRLRQAWGSRWISQSYFKVFMLQGLFMYVIALPLILIFSESEQTTFGWRSYLGISVWFVGFLIEGFSDNQLRIFKQKKENSGKIFTQGFWAWSRHPNYFGATVQWWGVFIMALPLPNGWMTIISPLAQTLMLLKVTGLPMLEEFMKGRPGYREYQESTSSFFPMPPRKAKSPATQQS